ncbi:MAG: TonB-dependent receptor plug domain-containing protein [Luteitalea sp.]|nr:TonB-dependent receptor plug domain-containing protein [Luteitalea sp.]
MRVTRHAYGLLAAFLAGSVPAHAQTGATGTILGTTTDPSGAVIAGATVTATNVDTGLARSSATGAAGQYAIFLLPIGRYRVRAEAQGFGPQEARNVELSIDQRRRVDFELSVRELTTEVTVAAAVPLVRTDDSSTSQVVSERAITELPLNGRNFLQLARLNAGVNTGDGYNVTIGGFTGDSAPGSVYGQRNSNNNFLLDGIQTTEFTGNRARLTPNIDAIQEFTLIKGIYPAEFGGVAGGTINAAVRSGTNELHGTLFEFLRDDTLDARNFFDTTGKAAPLKRNQFGATFGGPIARDRTFFFGSYDGLRLRQSAVSTTRVPTPEQIAGDLSSLGTTIRDPVTGQPFPGNVIPSSRIDPLSRALAAFWPAPNNPADPVRNYISSSERRIDTNQFLARLDHRLTPKDQLFARYAVAKLYLADPPLIPPFADEQLDDTHGVVLGYTRAFSPTVVNEARLGYTRIHFRRNPLGQQANFAAENDIPSVTRDPGFADVPVTSIAGYAGFGTPLFSPFFSIQNNYELADNLSIHAGKHLLKMGFNVWRRQKKQKVPQSKKGFFSFDGNYSGDNLGDFLLGLPQETRVGASELIPTALLWTNDFSLYVQDDWRLTDRLTLNLGLRYELVDPPLDVQGTVTNFNPETAQFEPEPFTRGNKLHNTDRNNFAPRVGFAFRPFGGAKTVLRGGYGVFYNRNNYDEYLFLPYNPPFGNVLAFQSLVDRPTLSLSDPFPTDRGTGAPIAYGVDRNLRLGYVQFFTLGVEREIARDTVFEVRYVGSKSTALAKAVNVNYAPPGPGAVQPRRVLRPDLGNATVVFSSSNASYHSLHAQLERRVASGLYVFTSYAYGKALDDVANSQGDKGGSNAQDPRCVHACEKGVPAYDRRQRFTLNLVYDLPFGRGKRFLTGGLASALFGGWQIASIFSAQSGAPLTVSIPGDPLNTGQGNARADYVGGKIALDNPTIDRWFNTDAFASPAPFTPGNLGRGTFTGPGSIAWDFSIARTLSIAEGHRLQFRAEFFNFPNHPNFGNPGTAFGLPTFGTIGGAGSPREVQLGLKYLF